MKFLSSLIISKDDFELLRSLLLTEDNIENAVFGICGFSKLEKETRILVRKLFPVPLNEYRIRNYDQLEVSPSFINRVIDEAEGKFAIFVSHSHPNSESPSYSLSDDVGEARLFNVFSSLIPRVPHVSLLFGTKEIRGRYWVNGKFRQLNQIKVVGSAIKKNELPNLKTQKRRKSVKAIYDRQVLAFGDEVQQEIGKLKVGIVGLGGTGSLVAEELVRLGVRNLILVDFDRFEDSNITRMYGTGKSNLGRRELKTSIIARHLKSIRKGMTVKEISNSIVSENTLVKLANSDVIFSCTDNDWSRSVLNRLAYQYMIPIIDAGIRIKVNDFKISGVAGRVSLIGPGLPCLWCSYHLDSDRIRVESMEQAERKKLEREGYIEGLPVRSPAVISLNSTIASLSVTMLLSLLSDFSRVPKEAPEQIYDAVDGILFKSRPVAKQDCPICGSRGLKGLGSSQVISAYR